MGRTWSASGRYLFFSELLQSGNVYLNDIVTGTTRDITVGDHAADITQAPEWSPIADVLLRPAPAGGVFLEDPVAATTVAVESLTWPATFDPSGTYVYSPAWQSFDETPSETTVVDGETLVVVATLPGGPASFRSVEASRERILAAGAAFVAALELAPGCDGTRVYRGTTEVACIVGATNATFSPDGSKVALARATGETGRVHAPGISASSLSTFDIVVVDVAPGQETATPATGLISNTPPRLVWGHAGSQLLVRWPTWNVGP